MHGHTKRNSDGEYAWFSFVATNPLFAINARRVAKQVIEACRRGQRELVITTQAKLAAMAQGLAPSLVSLMSEIVNRFLPQPLGADEKLKVA